MAVGMRQGLRDRPASTPPDQSSFLPVSGLVIHRPLVEPGLGEESAGRSALLGTRLEVGRRARGAPGA